MGLKVTYHFGGRMSKLELVENGGTIVGNDHFLVRSLNLKERE